MPRKPDLPRVARDRKRPKDGNWYIYWTEGGRSRERSCGTADREEAELVFAEWKLTRQCPERAVDPRQFYITDAISHYLTNRMDRVVDPERLGNAAKPIIKFFTGFTVGDVSDALLNEYRVARQHSRKGIGIRDSTIRRELGLLSAAIRRAHEDDLITRVVAVRLPPKPEGRIRFLTCKEAIHLIRVSRSFDAPKIDGVPLESRTEHLTLFLRIGLLTGQRKEAILSLRWNDIDFESKVIHWNPVGRRRTKKERPTSRIPKRLIKHLRQRQNRFPYDEYVLTHRGKPLSNIKRAFRTAVVAAGFELCGELKVVPHTLRHTCATWQMQVGTDKWEASGFLGMTFETLERTYGHHHPDHQKGAADAI